jgi:hypothetical protein
MRAARRMSKDDTPSPTGQAKFDLAMNHLHRWWHHLW